MIQCIDISCFTMISTNDTVHRYFTPHNDFNSQHMGQPFQVIQCFQQHRIQFCSCLSISTAQDTVMFMSLHFNSTGYSSVHVSPFQQHRIQLCSCLSISTAQDTVLFMSLHFNSTGYSYVHVSPFLQLSAMWTAIQCHSEHSTAQGSVTSCLQCIQQSATVSMKQQVTTQTEDRFASCSCFLYKRGYARKQEIVHCITKQGSRYGPLVCPSKPSSGGLQTICS